MFLRVNGLYVLTSNVDCIDEVGAAFVRITLVLEVIYRPPSEDEGTYDMTFREVLALARHADLMGLKIP